MYRPTEHQDTAGCDPTPRHANSDSRPVRAQWNHDGRSKCDRDKDRKRHSRAVTLP